MIRSIITSVLSFLRHVARGIFKIVNSKLFNRKLNNMSVTHSIRGGLVHLTGNPIWVTVVANTTPPYENHKLYVKVTCPALFGSPFPAEEIAPDKNLTAVFDISGFVDQQVAYDFEYPFVNKVVAHAALAFTVTIEIGQVYTYASGSRVVLPTVITENNVITVLKGKLSTYEQHLMAEENKTFASEYIDGLKFLTHQPNNQIVGPLLEMKLWLLSPWGSNKQILLNLEIETDPPASIDPADGEITNYIFQFTDEIAIANALLEFTVNPTLMGFNVPPGLHAPVGTKILAYSFWISNDPAEEEFTSERRRFIVDNNYYERVFEFYYVNPLSGVDVVRFTGEHVQKLKTESETSYVVAPPGSGTKTATLKTISVSGQRNWEINTGPKTRGEMLALRDFIEAHECWMVDPDRLTNRKLIPVVIEPGEFLLFDSMSDIQNFEIKIFEANR